MAAPSPEPERTPPSWQQLAARARAATPPVDLDLRASIRAEITSSLGDAHAAAPAAAPGLVEDILGLIRLGWFQAGLAAFAAAAFIACRDGLHVVHELAFLWSLQGPGLSGI